MSYLAWLLAGLDLHGDTLAGLDAFYRSVDLRRLEFSEFQEFNSRYLALRSKMWKTLLLRRPMPAFFQ